MKKSCIVILLASLILFTGCKNKETQETKSSSTTISTSSITEKNWLSINGGSPIYTGDNTIELNGVAKPETEVIVSLKSDRKEITRTKVDKKGNFIITFKSPIEHDEYLFENEKEKTFIVLYSKEKFEERNEIERREKQEKEKEEKLKQEQQAILDKKKQEEEKKESETTISESSEESYELTKESSISNNVKAEVTKEQKELLVVFTQQDLDDRDISYQYQGYDAWDVVTNDTTDLKRYIITTQDKKAGRIKSIYEWTGKKDDSATLIYLLVSGEEYVNNLS